MAVSGERQGVRNCRYSVQKSGHASFWRRPRPRGLSACPPEVFAGVAIYSGQNGALRELSPLPVGRGPNGPGKTVHARGAGLAEQAEGGLLGLARACSPHSTTRSEPERRAAHPCFPDDSGCKLQIIT